jgi:hypothetical protein
VLPARRQERIRLPSLTPKSKRVCSKTDDSILYVIVMGDDREPSGVSHHLSIEFTRQQLELLDRLSQNWNVSRHEAVERILNEALAAGRARGSSEGQE